MCGRSGANISISPEDDIQIGDKPIPLNAYFIIMNTTRPVTLFFAILIATQMVSAQQRLDVGVGCALICACRHPAMGVVVGLHALLSNPG